MDLVVVGLGGGCSGVSLSSRGGGSIGMAAHRPSRGATPSPHAMNREGNVGRVKAGAAGAQWWAHT